MPEQAERMTKISSIVQKRMLPANVDADDPRLNSPQYFFSPMLDFELNEIIGYCREDIPMMGLDNVRGDLLTNDPVAFLTMVATGHPFLAELDFTTPEDLIISLGIEAQQRMDFLLTELDYQFSFDRDVRTNRLIVEEHGEQEPPPNIADSMNQLNMLAKYLTALTEPEPIPNNLPRQ